MGITLIYSTTYFGIKFLENYFHCFVLYFPWLCARWQVASGHSYCLDKLSTKEIWGNVFLRIIWNVFLWIIWKVFLGIIKIFLRNICKVFFTYECSNSFQVNFLNPRAVWVFLCFRKTPPDLLLGYSIWYCQGLLCIQTMKIWRKYCDLHAKQEQSRT